FRETIKMSPDNVSPPVNSAISPTSPSSRGFRRGLRSLHNVPPFLMKIWRASPALASVSIIVRLGRAGIPVATLYLTKGIVDFIAQAATVKAISDTTPLWTLVVESFSLAICSDILGRIGALADSLLADRFVNQTSIELMRHAASLDLADFEN